jgi:hypothetical protein
LCCGKDNKREDEEEECTNTQRGALLESPDDDTPLQELVRRKGQIQGGEVLGKKSPAATTPPTQSGGAGRLYESGEADCEAASADDAEPDSHLQSDNVEVPKAALASPAPQRRPVSRFWGVCWDTAAKKWRAAISMQGVRKHLGIFGDEQAAARAYDKVAIEWGLLTKLNFYDYDLPETALASHTAKRRSSQFRGVSWDTAARKWQVHMHVQGVQKHLGRFDDEEAAARAYDEAAIECGLLDQLNFNDYELPETASASPAAQQESSRFQGVSWHKNSRKRRSRMTMQGVLKSLRSCCCYSYP